MAQQGNYPVENKTYNLLQVVTSKLEAIEAYQRYLKDADDETRGFLEECRRSEEQTIQRGLEILRRSLTAQREVAGVR